MKRVVYLIIIVSALFSTYSSAADGKTKDPNRLFYEANAYYEKRDYSKAIEDYIGILDLGIESGNIYYNAGNGFFKLSKLGYAILCYEKAARIIPEDSDLKSNLAYAKSMVEDSSLQAEPSTFIIKAMESPFRDLNLAKLFLLALVLYILAVTILSVNLINPAFAKKSAFLSFAIIVIFIVTGIVLALRYYDEEIMKYGIVIQKEAECKYEPIEQSTTYYKIHEGEKAAVLKTRNDWRQIKRVDGKISWVKREAVEEI